MMTEKLNYDRGFLQSLCLKKIFFLILIQQCYIRKTPLSIEQGGVIFNES